MYWPRRSNSAALRLPNRRPRLARGFTLVELMVGVLIGLLASLAVTQVMVGSEGQKRSTTSGSDAQVNGALALAALQRAIQPAGYGFAASPTALGCTVTAVFNGKPIRDPDNHVPDFPITLAPVVITQDPDHPGAAPDQIRVLASGKTSYSVPLRIVSPGYDPANAATNTQFPVASVAGVAGPYPTSGTVTAPGDLMLAVVSSSTPCEIFQVTSNPGANALVYRADQSAAWNAAGFPAGAYPDGAFLVNLGPIVDATYSIGTQSLRVTSLKIAAATSTPSYDGPTELFPNIVNLKAMYGKGTGGVVDTWDNVTPTTNADWQKVVAVRLALVARSAQYEKEEVTPANPQWDVGTAIAVTGTVACTTGSSKCLSLHVDNLANPSDTDWKHYRYKVFDTVIPLRNMLWNS
jgi:type IV pilus assembly protein PilW